jgi:hypothetical protein
VIDGFSNKLAAGVIFRIDPAFSGRIICDDDVYPQNVYLYVDAGTNCNVQPHKYYYFDSWFKTASFISMTLDITL